MSNLHFHGLKDPWADQCQHCGFEHVKCRKIDFYGEFKFRTQCEKCLEAEEGLKKLNELIGKTRRLLAETTDTPKHSELRATLIKIEKEQWERRNNLVRETKRFFAGRHQHKPEGTESRLPYKEN